jgi:hypothetical protein
MEHEVVGSGIPIAVDHVSMRVSARPEEVVPVIVLEDNKRRIDLDRHAATVPPRMSHPVKWGSMARPRSKNYDLTENNCQEPGTPFNWCSP